MADKKTETKAVEVDTNSDAFQAALKEGIASGIETETKGLKTKNTELLDKNKKYKDSAAEAIAKFDSFGGEKGLSEYKKYKEFIASNDDKDDLDKGNYEAVFAKRMDKNNKGWESKLTEQKTEHEKLLGGLTERIVDYKQKEDNNFFSKETRKAAQKMNMHPTAIDDAVGHVMREFTIQDSKVVKLDKDGDIVPQYTITDFLNKKRDDSPHWFMDSVGGGKKGSSFINGFDTSSVSNMSRSKNTKEQDAWNKAVGMNK